MHEKKENDAEKFNFPGWKLFSIPNEDIQKIFSDKGYFWILETRYGEKYYCIKDFPELTPGEIGFISSFLKDFREKEIITGMSEKNLKKHILAFTWKNFISLDSDQFYYLLEIIKLEVFGFSILSKLLENEELEEIAVIGLGKGKVFVYHNAFGWLNTNVYFINEGFLKNIMNKMGSEIGRRVSLRSPYFNACLPDGSRVNALISPVSKMPALTVRKFRKKPFTPVDLFLLETLPKEAIVLLWLALQTDSSILIAGNTGSGKTTTLNSLFYFVPKDDRIVVTEETPELNLPHNHLIKVNTAENIGVGMKELIVNSLRMRPDRVVVGEIRDSEEVMAFMDTLLAGQGKGSYATFHAMSSNEAIKRLRNLGVMEIDLASIDLIIIQKRWDFFGGEGKSKEIRKVVQISEVLECKGKALVNDLYVYDYEKGKLEKKKESIKLLGKISASFGKLGVEAENKRRELLFDSLVESSLTEEIGCNEIFKRINSV